MNYIKVIQTGLNNGLTLSQMYRICEESKKDTTQMELHIIDIYTKNI